MNREMQQMMSILSKPNGLKQMMLRPSFQTDDGGTFSQAELVADVVNIMRMDTKRMGLALGIEVEVNQMTPEYAAELLQGVAKGESTELIEVFDAIEDKRMEILEAVTDTETVQQWMERKASLLYTTGGLDSEAVQEEVATDDVETDFDPDAAAQIAHDAMEEAGADVPPAMDEEMVKQAADGGEDEAMAEVASPSHVEDESEESESESESEESEEGEEGDDE